MSNGLITAVSAVALTLAFPLASNAEERESPGASIGIERHGGDADHERSGRDADHGMTGSSLPHERREAPDDGRTKDRDARDRGSDQHEGADQENRRPSLREEMPERREK
jgi:hypothetical protein